MLSLRTDQNYRYVSSWSLICTLLLVLSGCASSWVVRTLYADLDTRAADRFKEYADFDQRQEQWIDDRAVQFHHWHRATQLPLYAAELKQLSARLEGHDTLSVDVINDLEQTVRDLTENIRRCHPINHASDFLARLSNRQIGQINSHMRNQHLKFLKRYEDESADERLQRRVDNITKWSGRLGAGFNQQQKDLLEQTLREQHSLGQQRLKQRSLWLDRFSANLQQRNSPQFADNLSTLLQQQWLQLEHEHPKQWRENQVLWTHFLQQFLSLQTPEQRTTMLKRTSKFASTISAMSGDRAASTSSGCS